MKYPSAKNSILLVVAIVIIIGAFLIAGYEKKIATSEQNSEKASIQDIFVPATTTMQNPSIIYNGNWQKSLSSAFGSTSSWTKKTANSSSLSQDSLTATDVFSRDLFSKYAEYQQAGVNFNDPQIQQQIIGQVLSDGTYIPRPKIYSKSDIRISPMNDKGSIMAYGNRMGNLIKANTSIQTPELDIVNQSLANKDPLVLKQLEPIVANEQKILQGFLATPVPSTLVDIHLNLINAMSELTFADQNLEKIYSDGLVSIAGLGEYQKGYTDFGSAFLGISEYFKAANISFGPGDGGLIFGQQRQ